MIPSVRERDKGNAKHVMILMNSDVIKSFGTSCLSGNLRHGTIVR